MRQVTLKGPRRLALEELEPRALGPHEVRLVVAAAGICGSDVHGYAGVNGRRPPGTVMGHEVAGRVVELGAAVEGLRIGAPLALNPVVGCGRCPFCAGGQDNLCADRRLFGCTPDLSGGYAEAMVVPAANAVALSDGADLDLAALVEPLAVGTHAARIAGEPAGDVLVVGGGAIGLAAALAARRHGAARVMVSEPLRERWALCERLGFQTLDPRAGPAARGSFALAFDCVGHGVTVAAALEAVAPQGTVVAVGLAEETIAVPAVPLVVGERVLRGSSAYTAAEFADTAAWRPTHRSSWPRSSRPGWASTSCRRCSRAWPRAG